MLKNKICRSKKDSNSLISHLEVVTSFKSRHNPVRKYATENKIILHNWEDVKKDSRICCNFDFGLVVSFGHLIPENMIESFKNGMLNLHASLLPKYRGASPIIYALKNHEKSTGVSIMRIEPKKFDVGDILAQKEVSILDDTLMPELHDKLANIGAELMMECIENYNDIKAIPQNSQHATYAPKIENEFCKIRWNEMTALNIFDLYRALYSFKNLTTTFRNEPLKIVEIAKSANLIQKDGKKPGHVRFCWKTKRLLVRCADDRDVEIVKLSIGKKVMSASDFNNGFLKKHSNHVIFE